MTELSFARKAYLEALNDAFEFQVDPIQLLIAGMMFDVKSLKVENEAAQILDKLDVLVELKLQDGRELTCLASAIQGFVTGRPWE